MHASRTQDHNSHSRLKPFGIGVFAGVVLCLGAQWLWSLGDSPGEIAQNLPGAAKSLPAIERAREPVLDFYTRLREVEVLVPDEELIPDTKDRIYLLQAGSFRQAQDADRMRAELILLNMNAEISKFNHNGEIWHRVIVGPFDNHSAMASARTNLLENGINSLLLTKDKPE